MPIYFKRIIFIILLYNAIGLFSEEKNLKDHINNGILDLKNFINEEEWKIELGGNWEFYWDQLLTPEDFKNKTNIKKDYLKVPAIWTNKINDNKKLPAFGYGTYRITVAPLHNNKVLSLDLNRILTSYKLWINGALYLENGKVGKSINDSKPEFSRRIINFYPKSEDVEIVIQVSNFYDSRGGGIFRKMFLGTYEAVQKSSLINYAIDLILIGALFFACLYHFIIYILRKKDKILIVFSLFFLVHAIRIILTNNNFLFFIFPDLPWEIFFKFEITTILLNMPLLAALVYQLFKEDVHLFFLKFNYAVALIYIIVLIIIPAPYFVSVMVYYYPVLFLICFFFLIYLIKSIKNKRDDSIIFGITFIGFFAAGINDILFSLSISTFSQMMPFGLMVFATVQALIIARRFSASFYKQEELSVELLKSQKRLEQINIILEEKVKERTIALENQIIERAKMEKEIIKNQKLDAIGLLAGGIAHDFNNLLSIILGNITLIKLIKDNEEQFDLSLKDAEAACKSASLLTNQLLTFSRGGEPVKQTIEISGLIKEITDFTLSGTSILPEYSIDKNLWNCDVDRGQFTQVITNLIINAKQAMNSRGKLLIKVENINEKSEIYNNYLNNKFIKISIKDTGPGIAKENISKIFDPFFSTKDGGKGLGLTTSFSIIKKHNGFIFVESEEGNGSTFTVLLPANDNDFVESGIIKNHDKIKALSGRVLVLDDEEYVIELLKRMLSLNGLEVVAVTDGTKAIEIYKNDYFNKKEFLFVISDLTIPGSIGGLQVLTEILKINKNQICVVSSGYSNDPVMSHPEQYGFFDVLQKPYSVENLNDLLKKIIIQINKD